MTQTYSYFDAVVLGVIQGLTEFLPISSSGHLTLAGLLLGIEGPKLFLNVMLHAGTLFAVLFVFREDLGRICMGFFRGLATLWQRRAPLRQILAEEPDLRLGLMVILATIPTGLFGLFLKDVIEEISTPVITGGFLILSGILLLLAKDRGEEGRPSEAIGIKEALGVGVAQGLAVFPGLSRSGSTIAVGLFHGLEREAAARYSFLLSIPAIVGAIVLELGEALKKPPVGGWGPVLAGTLVSLAVGFFALRVLLWLVRGGKLHTFAYYLFPVGALAIILGVMYA